MSLVPAVIILGFLAFVVAAWWMTKATINAPSRCKMSLDRSVKINPNVLWPCVAGLLTAIFIFA